MQYASNNSNLQRSKENNWSYQTFYSTGNSILRIFGGKVKVKLLRVTASGYNTRKCKVHIDKSSKAKLSVAYPKPN